VPPFLSKPEESAYRITSLAVEASSSLGEELVGFLTISVLGRVTRSGEKILSPHPDISNRATTWQSGAIFRFKNSGIDVVVLALSRQ